MIHLISVGLTLSSLSAAPVSLSLHDPGGERGATQLRFLLHSTKAGLIKTDVEGHVNDFNVSFDWTGKSAKKARVQFAARDMRTDNASRDEKMWNECLDADHQPRVEVQLDGEVPLDKPIEVPGRIFIRGAWHPLRLATDLRRVNDSLVLVGHATVKLSELDIPDPSIWIAKVDDAIQLTFQVVSKLPAATPSRT